MLAASLGGQRGCYGDVIQEKVNYQREIFAFLLVYVKFLGTVVYSVSI